jgi:imidazolonepropionase-like amidohydrolase
MMRVRRFVAACLLVFVFSSWSTPVSTQEAGVTVFENVRVLTMTDAGVLESATVIVRGDRISSVTRSAAQRPTGVRVIDGKGSTLLPGLADMHVHYRWPEFGPLFLINGVTTVRDTAGSALNFASDAAAKAGALAGPHVYGSGPLLDGRNPTWPDISAAIASPEEARAAVAVLALAGFRAVKLYHGLDAQTFSAAVTKAHELDMQVYAHTPAALTYLDMLALRVNSLEHLWFTQYSLMDERPDSALNTLDQAAVGWDRVEEARMPSLAARTREAGLWNAPTLTVYTQMVEYGADTERFFARPEATYSGAAINQMWRVSAQQPHFSEGVPDRIKAGTSRRNQWVKTLYDAGAGLLVGTDTPNPFIVPGYSFHEEIANLSKTGIPNDALLRMATVEAARFLRVEGEFGVVAVGARADLILVEGDPSKDLDVLRRPAYVMVNGHLRERAALQRELDARVSSQTLE